MSVEGATMPSILSLPCELHEQILDLLDLQDLAHLSSTCHGLRAVVAPRLFRSIVLTDNVRVADSACLAAGRYGAFVRRLKMVVGFLGCTDPACDCFLDTEACYAVANPDGGGIPASAEALLAGLEGALPALESITVEFPARYKHAGMLYGDNWDNRDPQLVQMRNNVAIVVRAVTTALARNTRVGCLSLVNYPPLDPLGEHRASPSHKDAWERLLGQLAGFHLSLFGDVYRESGAEEMLASSDYRNFLQQLRSFFFGHLRSVRRLAICCSQHAPLGGILRAGSKANFCCALELDPDAMPFLEHLELANMFLGPELSRFLVERAERPMSLSLTSLKADDVEFGQGYTWERFFDQLVESRVFIWRLEWAPSSAPLERPWWGPETTVSKPAQEIVARDPNRRALPYTWGQWRVPCFGDDVHRNIRSIVEGADQEAYNRFVHLVECNGKRRHEESKVSTGAA